MFLSYSSEVFRDDPSILSKISKRWSHFNLSPKRILTQSVADPTSYAVWSSLKRAVSSHSEHVYNTKVVLNGAGPPSQSHHIQAVRVLSHQQSYMQTQLIGQQTFQINVPLEAIAESKLFAITVQFNQMFFLWLACSSRQENASCSKSPGNICGLSDGFQKLCPKNRFFLATLLSRRKIISHTPYLQTWLVRIT